MTQNVVTYTAVIDVDNPKLQLKPGMTATLTAAVEEKHDVLTVPNSALRFRPEGAGRTGGPTLWKVDGSELKPVKTTFEPDYGAVPTREEIAGRLDDPDLMILDVRIEEEFRGKQGYPCDPRQGRIPGARHLPVQELFAEPGRPLPGDQIRARIGDPAEIVAYCHSGSRSALATLSLRAAGFPARNYAGSWHEWSRHDELPIERG